MSTAATLLLTLLATTSVAAQERGLRFGVAASVGRASLDIEGVSSSDLNPKTVGGAEIMVGYRLNDRLTLEARPGYATSGTRVRMSGAQVTISSDYFAIPVLATVDLARGSTRPYLLGGVGLALRLSAKAKSPAMPRCVYTATAWNWALPRCSPSSVSRTP